MEGLRGENVGRGWERTETPISTGSIRVPATPIRAQTGSISFLLSPFYGAGVEQAPLLPISPLGLHDGLMGQNLF